MGYHPELFDDLQTMLATDGGIWIVGSGYFSLRCCSCLCLRWKQHALSSFLGEYSFDCTYWYRYLMRCAIKARRELDYIVAKLEMVRCAVGDVERDLAVVGILHGYAGLSIYLYRQVGCEIAVCTPLMNGTDKIGSGGELFHLRIAFSEAVSASMNAGLLNRRSANFSNGAACLGSWMP